VQAVRAAPAVWEQLALELKWILRQCWERRTRFLAFPPELWVLLAPQQPWPRLRALLQLVLLRRA